MVKAQSKQCSAFGGAIFLCNHLTRKESFDKKIFGLSPFCADFVEKVKAGTTLFLYNIEQCKLHGVFEATSDGAVNIIPDAYVSSGQRYPSQIRFKRIWFCKPLMEGEFRDVVRNYSIKNKFSYSLSHQQVAKLLHLFSSRNRLQLCQNPRLKDDLPRKLETSLVKVTDAQSSPNSSSCGSFRSPCQTCSSSTLGDKLIDSVSLVHSGVQSDISDVAKSNSSQSPLHTRADTATVNMPSNQEAMHDQSTDDYIPLPQEEDNLEGVDDLFGLLKDESHSEESKDSSDSEDHTIFHQVCVRKEDRCYPPVLNSKLHSDSEGRTSVFSRLVKTHKSCIKGKRSKTEAFPPRSAQSFNPLSQRKKQRKAQRSKPFPCHSDRVLNMPSGNRLNRVAASNHSSVWRILTKYPGGKQSEIQTYLEPFLCEGGNKWDVSNKQPARYNSCKNSFVPKACSKYIDSYDNELNMPAVFAGEHDSSEVNVKEDMGTSSMNFKQHANDSYVEGGDQDFYSEDVEATGRKKKKQGTASFHQECPSDTALVPEDTETLDMLAISGENCKEKSISLSCKDAHTQLARPYLETKVHPQDEQQQSFQGSFEYVQEITCDSSLMLESSKTMDVLGNPSFGDSKTLLEDEMQSHVAAGHLGTETSLQQTETQSIRSCHRVVNGDKILVLGNFETMDILPNHDEDCENKSLSSDGSDMLVTSCHLEAEMPMPLKQTANIQSCSEVVHDDEALIPEISKVMAPKFNADCGNKGTSLSSGYMEEVCHLVKGCHEVVPSDAAPVLEGCGPLSNFPAFHGDSAKRAILLDETSGHLSTGRQDTVMLPQVNHYCSCCGDTSSVLEYSIVDTSTGDGDGEHKNSYDQKEDETLCLASDSKDHKDHTSTANTSSEGSPSCTPTDDQECSKTVLLKEEQYQNFQVNSSSLDSFAVSSEGSGSKSGLSADRTSGHLVADLLGMSSESRTSFINDSSNGSAATSGLGSEDADHNTNGSEAYAEPPILQHDPGEAME